ncbi:MAG: VWA domain-containing protein [Bacteroidales bacterium]|nr:VWA domain-containing protein [Bacteroidales bacterium]
MIHFQHPDILYMLIAVPLLAVLWVWLEYRKHKKLQEFADRPMFGRLIPDRSASRPIVKMVLLLLALSLLIITWANPQVGSKMVQGDQKGSDIAICLDVSNSMMAEDIQPNRLERSKRIVANLLNGMGGDRVSLVVFAGTSFIQMPLTNDYSATKMFLDQVNCDMIATQGTAIGDAIEKAMQTFGYGDEEQTWVKKNSRAIIVISDGENFEDDAKSAAAKAASEGIVVCTIGMGSEQGAPIPRYKNGVRTGFKYDRSGNTVTTRMDEQTLKEIAHAGNGIYVRAGNINAGLDRILNRIEHLEKDSMGKAMFAEYESRYMYPLVAALICLILEVMIFERTNHKLNLDKILKRK